MFQTLTKGSGERFPLDFPVECGSTQPDLQGRPRGRHTTSDQHNRRFEFFLTPHGAEGRTPDNYEADVHLGYPINAGMAKVNVILDVFNILDAQRPVLLDQRWAFEESKNSLAVPANPGYGKAALRTQPTSARLGVRVSF